MASYEILQSAAPYYRIRVRFDDCQFDQAVEADPVQEPAQEGSDDLTRRDLLGLDGA